MTNCRLMGGADWRTMTFPEYQAMLAGWNEHHAEPGDVEPPDPDKVRRALAHAGSIH